MKKFFKGLLAMVVFTVVGAGLGWALNEKMAVEVAAVHRYTLFDGEPFSYQGVVVQTLPGDAVLLQTGEAGDVLVAGIGPAHFWEVRPGGLSRPTLGDSLAVEGYRVDYDGDGLGQNLACRITMNRDGNDYGVDLRSGDGTPLWKRSLHAAAR